MATIATIALSVLIAWYVTFIVTCFILTSSEKKEETVECYSYRNGKIEYEGHCTMSEAVANGYMMTSENF